MKAIKYLKEIIKIDFGEIDIIAEKNKEIVFIEVKYRKTNKFGYGYEAVDRRKNYENFKTSQLLYAV